MSIPFTQYTLPNGRKSQTSIDCDEPTEALADRFIEAGGRFECEVLTTGEVSLTAVIDTDDGPEDIEIEICANGPGVRGHVSSLVCRAASRLPALALNEEGER